MSAATPRVESREWWAALVRHALASTLRSLTLPCAARCVASAETPDAWREIATEATHAIRDAYRAHEARAIREACEHMAAREPIGAAHVLSRARPSGDSMREWADLVAAEVLETRLSEVKP